MPHLQGKGSRHHACGKCKEECATWDGIFCDFCADWFHVKCEQLEIQHQEAFKDLPEVPYICKSCRTDEKGSFSFPVSLERLHKGAKQGLEKLYMYVERESQFIKEDLTYSIAKSPKYSSDVQAQALLQEYCSIQKRNAARVTQDGNTLFSAVSLALTGNEKLATELRVRCCIEMVVYEAFYRWQEKFKELSKCAPDYTESCLNCATPNEDSCIWTMSALATVTRRHIQSIYPPVNGKMDRAVNILNTEFTPRGKTDDGEIIKIFWSSSKKADLTPGSWIPDTFVPLVEMPTIPLSPMVLSPYLTPSRVSGRVRKPTAKVLAITSTKIKNELKVTVENSLVSSDEETAADFEMPADFTLEPTDDEPLLEKYRSENIDLNWMDKYTHVAEGGKPLKATSFLPAQEVFYELTTTVELLQNIPTGRKEDVYFLVDNSRNMKYKHRRNFFQDDCGRYNQRSGTTCKSFYLLGDNNILQQLIKDKGLYCKDSKRVIVPVSDTPKSGRGRPPTRNRGRGRGSATERKITKWIPLDPQPDEKRIVILHRYYSILDVDPSYRRRICWFTNLPERLEHGHSSFIAEYITKPVSGLLLPSDRKGGILPSTMELSHADEAEVMDQLTEESSKVEDSEDQVKDMDSQATEAEDSQVTEATESQTAEGAPHVPATEPEAMAPEAMAPEAMEPEAIEPETMEPDTMEPEAMGPVEVSPKMEYVSEPHSEASETPTVLKHSCSQANLD